MWPDSTDKYELTLSLLKGPFGNLAFRNRTVLVLGKNKAGELIVGSKGAFYPEGIFRMIGGGVSDDENVSDAVIRELSEETGLNIPYNELVPLAEVTTCARYNEKQYKMTAYIYFLPLGETQIVAGDDISGIKYLTEDEYRDLIQRFYDLAGDLVGEDEGYSYSWSDYGKVYGYIHQIALVKMLERGL